MKRTVIVHDEMGIFVGAGMGLSFWSLLECAGQWSVAVFKDEADARDFVGTWEPKQNPDEYRYVEIESAGGPGTITELDAAGLSAYTSMLFFNMPGQGSA